MEDKIAEMLDDSYHRIQIMMANPATLDTLHNLIMTLGWQMVYRGELCSFISCYEQVMNNGSLKITVTYEEFFPIGVKTMIRKFPYVCWTNDWSSDD